MGFLVLGAGAGVIVGSLGHFSDMFQYGFNIHGVVPNNEAIVAIAQNTLGSEMALIMFFGMFANILIARFTPLKYIFLTGHHTIYMAILISVILSVGGLSGWPLVVIGSVMLGFTMALMPAWAQPVMKKITGSDEIAFGHFGTFGYMFAAYIGKLVGKNSKSTEEIQFPKWLVFFRDTSVAISVYDGSNLYLFGNFCRAYVYSGKIERRTKLYCVCNITGNHFCGWCVLSYFPVCALCLEK
ncbi:PTS transporter subunit IIC [Treponema phagedenis]|uniref:PTS transporter subunit IIC n=2 Tax=Treponema phagedenis TaxID=162 RepID=UPI00210B8F21|nr:PTS transporter subunit IIC [Treponema phagedenis]